MPASCTENLLAHNESRAVASARSRLARTTPSLSGFVLMLGLRGRTDGVVPSHRALPRGLRRGVRRRVRRPDRRTTRRSTSARRPTRAVAPDGDEAWFVLVNAATNGPVGLGRRRRRLRQPRAGGDGSPRPRCARSRGGPRGEVARRPRTGDQHPRRLHLRQLIQRSDGCISPAWQRFCRTRPLPGRRLVPSRRRASLWSPCRPASSPGSSARPRWAAGPRPAPYEEKR